MAATAGAARGRVSVGHIALAVPLIAAVISGRIPVRDNSYLWHVRAGTLQIDLGRVLTEETIEDAFRHPVARLAGPAGAYFVAR